MKNQNIPGYFQNHNENDTLKNLVFKGDTIPELDFPNEHNFQIENYTFQKKVLVNEPSEQTFDFQEISEQIKDEVNHKRAQKKQIYQRMVKNLDRKSQPKNLGQKENRCQQQKKLKKFNLNKFLEGQDKFLSEKNNRLNEIKQKMKQQEEQTLQDKPIICENSKQMILQSSVQQQPFYDRLYYLRKNNVGNLKQEESLFVKIEENQQKSEYTYRPEINEKSKQLVRNQEISVHLYNDAKTRLIKQEKMLEESSFIVNKSVISENSNKVLKNKFQKEFQNATQGYQPSISYLQMNEILKTLGFLQDKDELSSNERKIVHDLWMILLKDENSDKVSISDLEIILECIQGIPVNFDSLQSVSESKYEDQKLLKKEFDLFYRNKLTNEKLRVIKDYVNENFKPQISKHSEILANKYRQKLVQEAEDLLKEKGNNLTHAYLLTIQKRAQEYEKILLQQKYEDDLQQKYSFKPKINPKRNKSGEEPGKRYITLYEQAKPYYLKSDKEFQDIDFEKNKNECTFKPKIHKNKNYQGHIEVTEIRGEEKTVDRLKAAREERELVNKWKERGFSNIKEKDLRKSFKSPSSNKQFQQRGSFQNTHQTPDNEIVNTNPGLEYQMSRDSMTEDQDQEIKKSLISERIPILYVDVNLGPNKVERITIYEEDQAEELAENFQKIHNIDNNMKKKLVLLLKEQIDSTLTKIVEENSLNSEENKSHSKHYI